MVSTTEIAPEIYRISLFVPEINLEFSHFLVSDEEPLLFHAGLRGMFPLLRQEISRLMDPSKLRHVGFSHFESDECGGLNEWLQLAPSAEPVCGLVGAMVSVNDFAIRPARALTRDDVFSTGRYSFRFIPTPHVPHGWDAGVLFEESQRTLFCSDLFHQWGRMEPTTSSSIIERCKDALVPQKLARSRTMCRIHTIRVSCCRIWGNMNRRLSQSCMGRAIGAMVRRHCGTSQL